MKAIKHIPNCVAWSGPKPTAYVNTTEELLNVDWVKSFKEWPEFNNFCRSKDDKHLMIESEDGTWWWCVARVDEVLDLPVARMITCTKN